MTVPIIICVDMCLPIKLTRQLSREEAEEVNDHRKKITTACVGVVKEADDHLTVQSPPQQEIVAIIIGIN